MRTKKEDKNEILNLPLGSEGDILKKNSHKLVIAIVKKGYAYQVIKIANENGGKGAVILDGRGVSSDKKRFFGIDLAPEKEAVMMAVDENFVYPIVKSIYAIADFKSDAKGVVFVLPISMMLD